VPECSHVANAVGAAISSVKSSVIIEITQHEGGMYLIPTLALRQDVQSKGGKMSNDAEIRFSVSRVEVPGMSGDAGLISAKVQADCEAQLM